MLATRHLDKGMLSIYKMTEKSRSLVEKQKYLKTPLTVLWLHSDGGVLRLQKFLNSFSNKVNDCLVARWRM